MRLAGIDQLNELTLGVSVDNRYAEWYHRKSILGKVLMIKLSYGYGNNLSEISIPMWSGSQENRHHHMISLLDMMTEDIIGVRNEILYNNQASMGWGQQSTKPCGWPVHEMISKWMKL